MIVFDLKCESAHVFEVWFASSSAFEEQRAARLVACPICGSTEVVKALMAPNLGSRQNRKTDAPRLSVIKGQNSEDDGKRKALTETLAIIQSKLLEGSSWVGKDFERQARAMDAGETEPSSIHGEVSAEQAQSLIDDGISVLPLPFPVIPPDKRN